jgi:hypothetical protein
MSQVASRKSQIVNQKFQDVVVHFPTLQPGEMLRDGKSLRPEERTNGNFHLLRSVEFKPPSHSHPGARAGRRAGCKQTNVNWSWVCRELASDAENRDPQRRQWSGHRNRGKNELPGLPLAPFESDVLDAATKFSKSHQNKLDAS